MFRIGPLFLLFWLLPALLMAAPDPELQKVATTFSQEFPGIPLKTVHPSPIQGVFEIVTEKDDILYYAPQSQAILVGEIWSSQGQNLTRESKDQLLSDKAGLFPLDKALKIGNGPNQVIEVSDPDCPFCREGSAFFSGREDVTRYVFIYPLSKIHPHSEAKARYILSAEDPVATYEEVFSGAYDQEPLPAFEDNGMLDKQTEIIQKLGIHSTPHYWINGRHISGTNLQKMEQLLDQQDPASQP
jgi:thiol:disulfide interchange protein DsbC